MAGNDSRMIAIGNQYLKCMAVKQLKENERTWFPRWFQAYGADSIAEFLTDLALGRGVSASTQNQALSGILFYYRMVLARDVAFVSSVRAKVSSYRPMLLTQSEVSRLGIHLSGVYSLIFWQPDILFAKARDP